MELLVEGNDADLVFLPAAFKNSSLFFFSLQLRLSSQRYVLFFLILVEMLTKYGLFLLL